MSVLVESAGLQTTIQSSPRSGFRQLGIPSAGPADPLSMALANHLVGNALLAPALEIALTGPGLRFSTSTWIAITGGTASISLNGATIDYHRTIRVGKGDELHIAAVETGARIYLAFAGGLAANKAFGSASTYMPALLGGLEGRALQAGDKLSLAEPVGKIRELETPQNYRPPVTDRWMLRSCRGAETHLLSNQQRSALFEKTWTVGRRADRMGIQLEGSTLHVASAGRLPSAAVFPGTIQCPEDGTPYLLCVDAQTIGGYPRVAQIARADRHLLGQMRPGDRLLLLPRQPAEAVKELRAKHDYWRKWLPGIESVI